MTNSASGQVYDDITQRIGNTPLVRLNSLTENCQATVLAKMENVNPLWSVKDRIGFAVIVPRPGSLVDCSASSPSTSFCRFPQQPFPPMPAVCFPGESLFSRRSAV